MYKIKKGTNFDSILIKTNDLLVEFIDYGATIKQIQTKNHLNEFQDILLEFKNPEDYWNNSIYLNATIGPIAGRVKHGEIVTNNNQYQLDKNQDNKHALHSSNLALSYKKFNYKVIEIDQKTKVVFSYVESSFSDLKYNVTVTYTVFDNIIKIHYNVESETDFFFNLTNHAYFNLSGNLDDDIKNHVVNIRTNKHHILDEDLISTYEIQEDKLYDFTSAKSLKAPLMQLKRHPNQGYDDIFFFPYLDINLPKVTLYEPQSKRGLDIYSTYDHMVFYTHNNVNNKPLKHLNDHKKHYGLCFEFQKSPHGFKNKHASNTYLEQNHQYNEEIILKFTLKD